ncbi:para-nitrobenzyl esterase-like [Anopheles albimanus]|uniref:Carboxylic ester hydrolase n=1 Tax=Anopheles albimanus TaxID=7167 RepID=A0A182FU06_ANOAL|nr:para-nitrobenzyl esterase-like [Anopheles albimanus]
MVSTTPALVLLTIVASACGSISSEVSVDAAAAAAAAACKVELSQKASAQGVQNRTFNDVAYCAYLGLRYARPPIGELRFADPVPQELEGHRNYTAYGSVCAQFNNINLQTEVKGDEDCLFLNIFTPLAGRDETGDGPIKYPVLVFVHGGSFIAGSGEVHGVDLLMDNEVVVVTLNYRLGVLGFLRHDRYNLTGNYGLKDQLVALEWIVRYVEHFGGDPQRVTLMGHSAGGAAVTHHLYHPRARQLFQGLIVLSGSMLAPWALNYDYRKCTDNYLHDLSATTLEELRELDFKKLYRRDARLRYAFAFSSMFYSCFIPTLEAEGTPGAYFSRAPHLEVLRTASPSIPILMSETSSEFEQLLDHVTDFWMSDNFLNNRNVTLKRQIAEILDNLSGWYVAQGLEESRRRFYQMIACMANVRYPIRRLLDTLVSDSLYYMRFEFDGKFGEYKKKTYVEYVDQEKPGALHGDELGYIFSPFNLREALANRSEYAKELSVHIKTVQLLSNFVKYGNPTPKRSKAADAVWPTYSAARGRTQYLNVNDEFHIHPERDRDLYYLVWTVMYECLYYSNCSEMEGLQVLAEEYAVTQLPRSNADDYDLDEDIKNNVT